MIFLIKNEIFFTKINVNSCIIEQSIFLKKKNDCKIEVSIIYFKKI